MRAHGEEDGFIQSKIGERLSTSPHYHLLERSLERESVEGGKRVRLKGGGGTMKHRQFSTCCPERFLKQTLFGRIIDVVFSAPLRLQS